MDHRAYRPSSLSTIKPINHQAYQPSSLSTIIPIVHLAYPIKWSYKPSSPLTIEPIDLSSSFATFKPFGLLWWHLWDQIAMIDLSLIMTLKLEAPYQLQWYNFDQQILLSYCYCHTAQLGSCIVWGWWSTDLEHIHIHTGLAGNYKYLVASLPSHY